MCASNNFSKHHDMPVSMLVHFPINSTQIKLRLDFQLIQMHKDNEITAMPVSTCKIPYPEIS